MISLIVKLNYKPCFDRHLLMNKNPVHSKYVPLKPEAGRNKVLSIVFIDVHLLVDM